MLQQFLPWFTGIMPGSWIGKAGGLGMSMILVYSLAWLIYKVVEQPGIALGRKLMG
jgi:peptidoglycan/LPS O-acetylase OafA/YrhL